MRTQPIRSGALVLLVVLPAIIGLTGTAVAHSGDNGYHHHDGWMGTHGNWGWLGMDGMLIWGLVLIGVPALVLYAIVTRIGGTRETGREDALSVLRQRYARGEIDDDEFETRRQQLQQVNESH